MVDEPKKPGENEQKPGQVETPPNSDSATSHLRDSAEPSTSKGIEDLLKELPKVDSSRLSSPPPKPPSSPQKPPEPPKPRPSTPPAGLPGQTGGPDKFKSFMRTMDEDLASAKKGMKPESKPFEIKPPPGGGPPGGLPEQTGGPKPLTMPPTGPKPTSPEVKLGPTEKTKSLKEGPKPPPPPGGGPPLASQPQPALPPRPSKFKISPRFLIIIVIAVVVFAGVWFFLSREPEQVVVTTPTPTPTPRALTLSELIVTKNQIIIAATEDFETAFNNELLSLSVSAGDLVSLETLDENGNAYSVSQIMDGFEISPPQALIESLDQSDWALTVFGQQENFDENGLPVTVPSLIQEKRLGLVARVSDSIGLRSALNAWEITMTEDLRNLFDLDPADSTSETFLDNIYNDQDLRYRNFPYADKTIDHAIVFLPGSGAEYFVITNSRESAYFLIDLIQNQ